MKRSDKFWIIVLIIIITCIIKYFFIARWHDPGVKPIAAAIIAGWALITFGFNIDRINEWLNKQNWLD